MGSQNSKSDAWLDAELRNVSLPADLLRRLRRVAVAGDEALDAAIRDVPVPVGLRPRLQRIGEPRLRPVRLGQMAMAASLLIAIGLCYVGAMAGFLWTVYTVYASPQAPPGRLDSQVTLVALRETDRTSVDTEGLQIALGSGPSPDLIATGPLPPTPEVDLLASGTPVGSPSTDMEDLIHGAPVNLLEDLNLVRWPIFAAHSRFDELEDLGKVAGLKPRGINFPFVPGYDVSFLSKTNFHPFIAPAAHPQLRSVVVPLGADTSSFALTQRHLEDREVPPRDKFHSEEFLAAIDYQFPRPKQEALGLHVAGGPSPFRAGVFELLQFGVQARDVGHGRRPATRLTLAVDVSASMRWGGRLEMVRRALREFVGQLGAEDRVSLVVFGEEAYVVVEDIGSDRRELLLAAIDSLAAQGSTNVGAGLRHAYAVAQHGSGPAGGANRVVLLTDALAELDPGSRDRIDERVAEAAARGIRLDVIDLRCVEEREEVDPLLAGFARAGAGRVHRATNPDQVRWALLDVITGKSQLVAADARLKVTFNPKSVAAYRLLGHEPRSITGLKPARSETDFYAGQSGTALFEVQLRRSAEKEVAVAELSWRDPQSGQVRRSIRKFRRGEFASSLVQAPVPLQAAAVAAAAVEVLRVSPFEPAWPNPRSLADVIKLARQVDTRLQDRPKFAEFISVIEQVEAIRPYRSGG